MSLTIKRLTEVNVERCIKHFQHPLEEWSLMEWGSAAAGECGEANNIAKKMRRFTMTGRAAILNRKGETQADLQQKLAKEIADTIHYCVLWSAAANIDLEKALTETFNKVSEETGASYRL